VAAVAQVKQSQPLDYGAIDFLIKPFEDQELLLAIQRALEKSREQQLEL